MGYIATSFRITRCRQSVSCEGGEGRIWTVPDTLSALFAGTVLPGSTTPCADAARCVQHLAGEPPDCCVALLALHHLPWTDLHPTLFDDDLAAQVPLVMAQQQAHETICQHLQITDVGPLNLVEWKDNLADRWDGLTEVGYSWHYRSLLLTPLTLPNGG